MKKILTNGRIYIDSNQTVENLLIKDSLVEAHNVEIKDYPDAEVYDLQGNTAYPGFNDSHVHVLESGYVLSVGINLNGADTTEAICSRIKQKISDNYHEKVALGLGFSFADYDQWSFDDLAKLDQASGNLPVMAFDTLGHNAIINSAGMKALGIDENFKTPFGGKVIRQDGKPTGMFREAAMSYPGTNFLEQFSMDAIKRGAKLALDYWAKQGYTAIIDLMGAPGIPIMKPEVFYELEQAGELNLRVNYCYTISNANQLDDVVNYVGRDTDLVRFFGGKIFVDGAFGGGEAWTSWAHKNDPDNYGLQAVNTDDSAGSEFNIYNIIAKAEKLGINMHYHTQGDKAIEAVLRGLELVIQQSGKLGGVHTLAHVGLPREDQISRMKVLGKHLCLTMQPAFWELEDYADSYYGFDNMQKSYPVKKLLDAGLNVGLSTDFNVSPISHTAPIKVLQVAVLGGGKYDFQPLTAHDFIKGFSLFSSLATAKYDVGTLGVGQKADLVVMDKDFVTMTPEEINTNPPQILHTIVSGNIVKIGNVLTALEK